MTQATEQFKQKIYRRIALRSVIFTLWIAGLIYFTLQGHAEETGLENSTYFYMAFVVFAVWAVQLYRDIKKLRNKDYQKKAALKEGDERMVLITYKSTRLAATVMLCVFPVAVCVLSFFGMQQAVDTLCIAVVLFAVVYYAGFYYFNARG